MGLSTITRRQEPEIYYPSSDGKPMAETDAHVKLITETIGKLSRYYELRQEDVYVAGNNFIYFAEGDPAKRVSPDTYVVFGVKPGDRNSYKVWEEVRHNPDVVFEFTSGGTRNEDVTHKMELYERTLMVDEYFLFDPTADYIKERLRGYRLEGERYRSLPLVDGRMYSERLRMDLQVDGTRLNFYDAATGVKLLSGREEQLLRISEQRLRVAEQERADDEKRRADDEKRRADDEKRRADDEKQLRIAEQARADDEKRRADALEAEVAVLRRRADG